MKISLKPLIRRFFQANSFRPFLQVYRVICMTVSCMTARFFWKYLGIKEASGIRSIRVMLAEMIERITIRPEGSFLLYDEETHQQLGSGADHLMVVSPSPQGGLTIQASKGVTTYTARAVRFVSEEPFGVEERNYRGSIVVRCMGETLLVINTIGIEDYLKGVVPAEILSSAPTEILSRVPMEALKAQAVASRTFACYSILLKRPVHDVDTTVLTQIYKGVGVETTASSAAVEDTAGEVLAYGNQLAYTMFHSNCGGKTEDFKHVWGRAVPYLLPVDCPCCSWSQASCWCLKLQKEELTTLLKSHTQGAAAIYMEIASLTPSGRVKTLRIITEHGAWEIRLNALRLAVGVDRLRSGRFSIVNSEESVSFEGTGWGHGVGMCQNGAMILARKGYSYQEILKNYYPGSRLCRVSRVREK